MGLASVVLSGVKTAFSLVGCDVICSKPLQNSTAYDINTGKVLPLSPPYTPVTLRGYFSGYSKHEITEGWVNEGDIKLILSVSENYIPELNDTIQSNDNTFRVMGITPVYADEQQTVLWKLQLRK